MAGHSRADVKELGGHHRRKAIRPRHRREGKLEQALDNAELKAGKRVARELDVSAKDVGKAVQETAKDAS
jgi:hypothetical protein